MHATARPLSASHFPSPCPSSAIARSDHASTGSYPHASTASASPQPVMQRAVQSPTPRRTTAPPASPSLTLKPLDVSAANNSSGVYALVTPETTTTTASGVYAFDALLVATSVACTLLVVLVVVLILGVRLLKRVASAAVVAEAARAERAGRRRRQQQQQHPRQVYGARVDVDGSDDDAYLRDDGAEEVEAEGDGEAARDSARRARGRSPATGYALDEAQPLLGAAGETGRRDGSGHGGGRRRRQAASRARDTAHSPTAVPASMGVIDALTILFRVSATAHGHRRDASTTGDDDEDSAGSARSSDEGQGRYRHPRWRRRHAARERGSSSTAAGQRRLEDASAFGGDDGVDSPCAAAARRRGRRDRHSPAAVLVGRNGSLRGGRSRSSSSSSSRGNDSGRRPRAGAAVRPAAGTSACGQAGVGAAGVPPSSRRGHDSADYGASETHGSLQPASASGRRAAAQEAARDTATTEKDKVVYNTTHDSRYQLLQRIGTGAFSSVYLVQHKTTGQRYALKYILCKDDRERVAALRECELIHTLQGHQQVIRIVDMFMNYQFQGAAASPTGGAGEEKSGAARSLPVEAAKPTAAVAEAAPSAAHPRQHAAAPATSAARPSSAATSATAVSTSLVLPQVSPATTRWVGVQLKGLSDAVMTKVASATRLDDAEVTAALQSRIRRLGVAAPQRATPAHGRRSLSGDEGEEGSGGARFNAHWAGGGRGRPAATAAAAAAVAAPRGAVDENDDASFASTAGGPGYEDENDAASGRGTAVHADYDGLASSEQLILSAADTERLLVDARRLQQQRRRQREQQRQQHQHREHQQRQQQPQTRTQPMQTTQSQQRTWHGNASASASSFDVRSLQHSMQHASRSNSSSVNLIAHPFGVSPTSLGTHAATTAAAAAAAAAATTSAAADFWCKTPNINTHVSSVGSPGAVPAASYGRPRVGSTASLPSRGALARVADAEDVEGDAAEAGAVSDTAAATTTTAAISRGGLSGTALHTGTSRGGDTSAERSAAEGTEAEDEGDAAETASVPWHARRESVAVLEGGPAHDAGTGSSSSVTSASGEEEEPTQPIHRILVPPPSFMHPPPASPTAATAAAPRTSSPSTPLAPPPTAVGTPDVAAVMTATATVSTFASYAPARSAMNGGAPAGNRYSNFPLATAATALKPSSAAAADARTATSPAPTYAPSSPVADAGSPHASAPAASREPPLQTSSPAAATYAPARASAPAGAAPPMQAPVRYKDFTPAHTSPAAPSSPAPPPMSASWAGMLRESSNFVATQQQQPPHNASVARVCPVPQSYGNYRSPSAPAAATGALLEAGGAMPTPPVGLARDRQTGAYVNPYLSHATDAQEAPAPARTSYAPRGGVRYSGLVVPPNPTAAASMAATAATAPASYGGFMTPSNGVTQTGNASALASSGIATSGAAASSSASGPISPLESNGHGGAQSSYAPAATQLNSAAAPVSSLTSPAPAVRNTYAPLRYGNLIPPVLSPPSVALPSQLHLQKQLQQAELYPTNIASPTARGSADVGAARGDTSAPFPASSGAAGLRGRLSVSAAIRAARAGQQGERMHGNDGKPHIHVPVSASPAVTAAQAPHRPTPLHALQQQQQQQPAVGGVRSTVTSAPPYDDAPSPIKPQYTNLGVLLAGGSMTDGPGTPRRHGAAQEARAPDGLQPSFPARRAVFGSAAEAPAAAATGPSVRYANVGNPQAWTATGACAHTAPHVDAACAAAVAALTGVPLKAVSGGVAATPSSPSGSPTGRGAKSSTTSASVNSPSTSSGSLLLDVRDTGYLCLVMEYHAMGDLCRYALRAKHQLELQQPQQQPQSSPTPRPQLSVAGGGGVVSGLVSVASPSSAAVSPAPAMVTSASTLHTATEDSERSSVPRQHPHPSPSTTAQADVHGDGSSDPTTAASLLAAAAAATWRMRPAASRSELPLVASAGAAGQPSAPAMDEYADTHELPPGEADPTSDNPLTEAQLLSIAYQLASVLDHMHRQNPPIIHRDLKPENILIKGELADYLDLGTLTTSSAAVAAAAPESWTTASDAALPATAAPDGHARPATAAVRERGSNSNMSHARLGASLSGMDKSSASPVTPSLTPAAVRAAAAAMGTSGPLPPIRITRAVVPVVLTDFGLAILQDAHGRPHGGRGGGTRPYIAPESWHGGTCTASDVWSLGCVLYALATCRLVAKNVRIMSQEAKQDGFASRMLNDILAKRYSLAFASFVVSLLVVDPAKRPTAAQASQCFCVADGEVRFDPNSPFFSNVLDL